MPKKMPEKQQTLDKTFESTSTNITGKVKEMMGKWVDWLL